MNGRTHPLDLRNGTPLREEQPDRLRLRRQWAILRDSDPSPEGWKAHNLGAGLRLVAHPDCSVVAAEAGAMSAHLVGTAVRPSEGSSVGHLDIAELTSHSDRVRFLYRLGGVHAFLWSEPESVTVYTDPGAIMAVYHGDGRAASTPTLLPGLAADEHLASEYTLKGSDDWYPGDLVPFENVHALFANHTLDVRSGRTERFWPTIAPEPLDVDRGIDDVAQLLRGMARGYLNAGPCLFSLTGGQDSRVNLAAVRPWIDEVQFFTIRGEGIKDCDIRYAEDLARRFDLDHRFVENRPPEPWLERLHEEICASMQTRGATSVIGACADLAGPNTIHVSGALGAITKSMFWPSKRPEAVTIPALANEFVQKPSVLLDALQRWRETLPAEIPPTMVYNLMYLEQRGGRWQSVSELGSNLFYRPASLFASRELFEKVCAVPVERQYGGTLLFDFTRALWPELLEVPYCKVTANYGTYLPKWIRVGIKRIIGRPV